MAFSFSAGPLTITSDAAGLFNTFSFDFDLASPEPMIVDWFWAVAESLFIIGSCITAVDVGQQCPVDAVRVLISPLAEVSDDPGVWTKRAGQVPEPGTLWLLLTGLAALVLTQALGRRRGRPARP